MQQYRVLFIRLLMVCDMVHRTLSMTNPEGTGVDSFSYI